MIVLSVWRNSTSYIDRYFEQMEGLAEKVDRLFVVAVEGDSTDETYKALDEARETSSFNVLLLKVEHGGPSFTSVDKPLRWRQIASVCNVGMVAAQRELAPGEPLVYVESDLIWEPDVIARLVAHTETYPAVTCLSMDGPRFYDQWGYRKDGRWFRPWAPYCDGMTGTSMVPIDSCGSVIAMRHPVAQAAFFGHTDCVLGLGQSIYDAGFSLWLDPTMKVTHP